MVAEENEADVVMPEIVSSHMDRMLYSSDHTNPAMLIDCWQYESYLKVKAIQASDLPVAAFEYHIRIHLGTRVIMSSEKN